MKEEHKWVLDRGQIEQILSLVRLATRNSNMEIEEVRKSLKIYDKFLNILETLEGHGWHHISLTVVIPSTP